MPDSPKSPTAVCKEIEITPEMLRAGIEAMGRRDSGDELELTAYDVFSSMIREAGFVIRDTKNDHLG